MILRAKEKDFSIARLSELFFTSSLIYDKRLTLLEFCKELPIPAQFRNINFHGLILEI